MFRRLISAAGQSRSAKTVEVFGWLILFEGTIVLFAPHFAISLLGIEPLTPQTTNYFRLVGLLVSGLGMLYIASGSNEEEFVFASTLDRPVVPFAMGPLALIFSIQDFGSFLWTLFSCVPNSQNRRGEFLWVIRSSVSSVSASWASPWRAIC